MIELLFAVLGILGGVGLAFIAPEEFAAGKKYFLLLKRGLLLFIVGAMAAGFILEKKFALLGFPLLLLLLLFIELKTKKKMIELGYYLTFIISFFFLQEAWLAALLFLYGLPAGTLLAEKWL